MVYFCVLFGIVSSLNHSNVYTSSSNWTIPYISSAPKREKTQGFARARFKNSSNPLLQHICKNSAVLPPG
jgi:hypothetical protein